MRHGIIRTLVSNLNEFGTSENIDGYALCPPIGIELSEGISAWWLPVARDIFIDDPGDYYIVIEAYSEGQSGDYNMLIGEMTHFIDLLNSITGSSISRVHAERIGGDNQSAVNNDNIAVTLKFEEGSVANLTYAASGDKAYSREKIEIFFEGNTVVSEDFRISKKHFGGYVAAPVFKKVATDSLRILKIKPDNTLKYQNKFSQKFRNQNEYTLKNLEVHNVFRTN